VEECRAQYVESAKSVLAGGGCTAAADVLYARSANKNRRTSKRDTRHCAIETINVKQRRPEDADPWVSKSYSKAAREAAT
jgi:hypothetical protein